MNKLNNNQQTVDVFLVFWGHFLNKTLKANRLQYYKNSVNYF